MHIRIHVDVIVNGCRVVKDLLTLRVGCATSCELLLSMEELLPAVGILMLLTVLFSRSGNDCVHRIVASGVRSGPIVLQCVHHSVHVPA